MNIEQKQEISKRAFKYSFKVHVKKDLNYTLKKIRFF